MFDALFDAVLDGVKLALCWFCNFMAELFMLALDGVLAVFPDSIKAEIDVAWLGNAMVGMNYLFALDVLLGMLLAYTSWYLIYVAVRTVIKIVPFVG